MSVSLQLLFVQAGIVCPALKQADVEEDVFHRRLSAGVESSSTCISQVDRSLVEHSVRYSLLEVVPKRTAVVAVTRAARSTSACPQYLRQPCTRAANELQKADKAFLHTFVLAVTTSAASPWPSTIFGRRRSRRTFALSFFSAAWSSSASEVGLFSAVLTSPNTCRVL